MTGPVLRRRAAAAAFALVAGHGLLSCEGRSNAADGTQVEVAAASNFAPVLDTLFARFTAIHGVPIRASIAGTGQLYAQAVRGAPFHVLMAADEVRPRLLEEAGQAVPGTRFTFALGRLALYAPARAPLPSPPWRALERPGTRLAIANPRTAPYGVAAMELLAALGLEPGAPTEPVGRTLVTGENVAQALHFVRSGAAEVGLVARSQVVSESEGHWAVVPDSLHAALRHDAVLLERARHHEGARAFLAYLRTDEARGLLRAAGYDVPDAPVR